MNDTSVTAASVTETICTECLLPFEAKRHDAKCCSNNCRKRRSRRKASMQREMLKAMAHVVEIKRMMEKHEDLMGLGIACLNTIELRVRVTVAAVTDND